MKTQNYSRPPYPEGFGICESVASLEEQGFDFLRTPTIFGAKAQDVVEGADAAVGTAHLLTTFSISAPGAGLPDFLDVVFNPAPYAPVKFSFKSNTIGKCSNGKKSSSERVPGELHE